MDLADRPIMSFTSAFVPRLRTLSLLISTLPLAMTGCGGGGNADGDDSGGESAEESTAEASSTSAGETGMSESLTLEIRENPYSTIAPWGDVLETDTSEVQIEVRKDGALVRTYSAVDSEGDHATWLWGLRSETTYEATAMAVSGSGVELTSDPVSFTTGALPEGLPVFEISDYDPERAHQGMIVFGTIFGETPTYVGVDTEGEVVWYHQIEEQVVPRFNGDVTPLPDGRLFLHRKDGLRIIQPWGEIVFDEDVEYHHDVEFMSNGNFMLLVHRMEDIDVPTLGGVSNIIVDGIVEMTPAGETVREWWGSEHLDTNYYPSQLSQQGPPYDWTHGNAIAYDEARGRVLLSARHLHQVIAINWPSGEVAWALGQGGDFTLDASTGDWFYAQHAPEPQPDGSVLLYDNGNERPESPNFTRGLHVGVDETNMTAEILWEHRFMPTTPILGDCDRMANGNVLMSAGGLLDVSVESPRIIEATGDAASEVVWQLRLPEGPNLYRATEIVSF